MIWRVLMAGAVGLILGCGPSADDGFGPAPDFAKLDSDAAPPTGTLASDGVTRAVAVVAALRDPAVSILDLAHVAPSKTDCAALAHGDASGACACPESGSFSYDFSDLVSAKKSGDPAVLRMRFLGCGVRGEVLNGREFAKIGGSESAVSADLDVGGAPLHVWHTTSDWWSRVSVSDGEILVGVAPDQARRDVIVRDRAATWTCAEPRCTDPGGTTRDLT
jgi:hypothetical protein